MDQLSEVCTDYGKCSRSKCGPCHKGIGRCWEECVACVASRVSCRHSTWCDQEAQAVINSLLTTECLTYIDWLLHLGKKRYRDHAGHQIFVGALGRFLLHCRTVSSNGGSRTLGQWIADRQGWQSEEQVELAWWIASLLHDHAYPLSHMLQVTPALVRQGCGENLIAKSWDLLKYTFGDRSATGQSDNAPKGLYESELLAKLAANSKKPDTELRRRGLSGILDPLLASILDDDIASQADGLWQNHETCYDHGILAAANLAALLKNSRETKTLGAALRAIAIHNGPACHPTVDADKDPWAFLLILCDELQEWERRIVVNDEVLYESRRVFLNGIEERSDKNDYFAGDCLIVVFDYSEAAILERTEWDYTIFRKSKSKAWGRLNASGDFPIKRIEYRVQVPHDAKFVGPKK